MKKYLVIAKWTLSVDSKIRLLGDKFEVDEATLSTLNPELIEIVEEVPADIKEDTNEADETQEVKPKKKGKKQVKGGNNDTDTTETD